MSDICFFCALRICRVYLRPWQLTDEFVVALYTDAVTCLAFSPDSTRMVSGSRDRTARLCHTSTGTILQTFTGDEDTVTALAFATDGRSAYSAADDKHSQRMEGCGRRATNPCLKAKRSPPFWRVGSWPCLSCDVFRQRAIRCFRRQWNGNRRMGPL
jgi:WD40 repeat protein